MRDKTVRFCREVPHDIDQSDIHQNDVQQKILETDTPQSSLKPSPA
jgi:hypothetical protein